MKTCPNCGAGCADAALFCVECGSRLPEAAAVSEPVVTEEAVSETPVSQIDYVEEAPAAAEQETDNSVTAYKAPFYSAPVYASPVATGLKAELRKILSSKKAKNVAIFATVLLLLSLIVSAGLPVVAVKGVNSGLETLSEYSDEMGDEIEAIIEEYADDEEIKEVLGDVDIKTAVDGILSAVDGSSNIEVNPVGTAMLAITSHAWEILVVVAFWIIYANAKKNDSDSCGTSGITILKVLSIIKLVGVCLLVLIVLGLGIALVVSGGEDMKTAAIAVLAVIVIWAGLTIWFHAGKVSSLSAIKEVATDMPVNSKVSGFTAFWLKVDGILNIISGALLLLDAAVIAFAADYTAALYVGVALCAVSIFGAIVSLGEGKLLKECRKELKA